MTLSTKRKIIFWATVMLVAISITAFTEVHLYATGYDWIEYSKDEKAVLMAAMFYLYGLDRDEYSIEKGIELLDVSYYQARKLAKDNPDLNEDGYFNAPCVMNFGTIVNDKETEWGSKSLMKNNPTQKRC